MTREFLEELQLPQEVAEAVLQEHERAVQDIAFRHDLDAAIGRLRGRNATAIKALLDIPALQENPEGLEEALLALKKENGYLFEGDRPPVYPRATGTRTHQPEQPMTLASDLRERFEKRK